MVFKRINLIFFGQSWFYSAAFTIDLVLIAISHVLSNPRLHSEGQCKQGYFFEEPRNTDCVILSVVVFC